MYGACMCVRVGVGVSRRLASHTARQRQGNGSPSHAHGVCIFHSRPQASGDAQGRVPTHTRTHTATPWLTQATGRCGLGWVVTGRRRMRTRAVRVWTRWPRHPSLTHPPLHQARDLHPGPWAGSYRRHCCPPPRHRRPLQTRRPCAVRAAGYGTAQSRLCSKSARAPGEREAHTRR
jgi:hypothetical protein